jgi:hypothetical protein
MRERGITLLLAAGALAAFYGLWLQPASSLDPDADTARPTTAERRGNGYAGLYEWLQRSGINVRSFRERYTALQSADLPPRGNLLVLALPGVEVFRGEEFGALDRWVRAGNTLLINAGLLDQPGWAAGRATGAVGEIESLISIEFETRAARELRLDDTPLAQRVREADARDVAKGGDEDDELSEVQPLQREFVAPPSIPLTPTGPHVLLAGVRKLAAVTDYEPEAWSLRMPYDSFVLTLARTADGEGALFEQRLGRGRILLSASGSLFTNRALAKDDNARLFANIVGSSLSPDGAVLFDDLRQGLSASYDPARFYKDPRLFKTIFIALALWLVWVLGSTRLRAPAIVAHDPSEAELVRHAGGLVARTVAPFHTALRLFDHFFAGVARAARGARGVTMERGELWHWLEQHAAILPQELDQLKTWYADAHAERNLPLAPLQNLLDTLEKRLKT